MADTNLVFRDTGDITGNEDVSTVPANRLRQFEAAVILLTTSATVGNRRMGVDLRDDQANTITVFRSEVEQPASETLSYVLGQGIPADSVETQKKVQVPTVGIALPEGWSIRVYDVNDIDAAGDVLRVISTLNEQRVRR